MQEVNNLLLVIFTERLNYLVQFRKTYFFRSKKEKFIIYLIPTVCLKTLLNLRHFLSLLN